MNEKTGARPTRSRHAPGTERSASRPWGSWIRRLSLGRPAGASQAVRYDFDIFDEQAISGWAVHPTEIRDVRVHCDDVPVGSAEIGLERPDVRDVFPGMPGSDRSGFRFLPGECLREGTIRVTLEIEAGDGTLTRVERTIVKLDAEERRAPLYRPDIDVPVRSGFPFEVTESLRAFRPGAYNREGCWDDALMAQAIDDIKTIWRSGARSSSINRYVLFLKTMHDRFLLVGGKFPRFNEGVAHDAKDRIAIATTPAEMLVIANYLNVLKSNGLDGHFLEFGCFKGFSSSCLSFCCHHLRIPMEVFDSFAGLPASDHAGYLAGDFCGALGEVRANVDTFGELGAVEFHGGFFEETVPRFDKRPILCIWMDVDLSCSARDVAGILGDLPRASAVLTHEFPPDGAQDGRVIPGRSEVLPPILDRFESLRRTPTGRHLGGCLGAIWDAAEGIPVVSRDLLMELVDAGG